MSGTSNVTVLLQVLLLAPLIGLFLLMLRTILLLFCLTLFSTTIPATMVCCVLFLWFNCVHVIVRYNFFASLVFW